MAGCEAVICVKDRGNDTAPKQGDVIELMPEGFGWCAAVLGVVVPGNPNGNHNFFRWLKFPNVTLAQAQRMLAKELDVDPLNPSPVLQFRSLYFDKDKIPTQVLRDYWNDDTRAAPFIVVPFTAAQLNNIVSTRPPIPFVSTVLGAGFNGND